MYIWARQFTRLLKNLTHERIKIYLVLSNTIMTKYITGKIWSSWDPGSSHRVFPFSWVLVRKLVDKDRWILKETSRAMLATDLNWEFPNHLLFVLAQDGFPILSLALWVHKWRKDILLRWAVIWGPWVLPTRNPDRVWRKRWSDGRQNGWEAKLKTRFTIMVWQLLNFLLTVILQRLLTHVLKEIKHTKHLSTYGGLRMCFILQEYTLNEQKTVNCTLKIEITLLSIRQALF